MYSAFVPPTKPYCCSISSWICSDKVVEPSDDSVVHLLEALPPMEALYYAKETNVIERGGKSAMREI